MYLIAEMDTFKSNPVYNLGKSLNTDKEVRKDYIEGNVLSSDTSSDSSSDSEEDTAKIVIKKKKRKKNNKKESSMDLLERLIQQQQDFLKVQKKVYKLESEITIEETKSRYIKLDLNNAVVKYEEETEKSKKLEKTLLCARIENWTCRILFLLYIIFQVFYLLYRIYSSFNPQVQTIVSESVSSVFCNNTEYIDKSLEFHS